jgi:hypothetical protein
MIYVYTALASTFIYTAVLSLQISSMNKLSEEEKNEQKNKEAIKALLTKMQKTKVVLILFVLFFSMLRLKK